MLLDTLFPLCSFAAKNFGDLRTGEVVGLNYHDDTVVLYFSDDMTEETVHVNGLRRA